MLDSEVLTHQWELLKEKDCFWESRMSNSADLCAWQNAETHFMQILNVIQTFMKDWCSTLCNQPSSSNFFFSNLKNPQAFKSWWNTGFQVPPRRPNTFSVKWLHPLLLYFPTSPTVIHTDSNDLIHSSTMEIYWPTWNQNNAVDTEKYCICERWDHFHCRNSR